MKVIRIMSALLHIFAFIMSVLILGSNPISVITISITVILGMGTYVSLKNLKKDDLDFIKKLMNKIFGPDQNKD